MSGCAAEDDPRRPTEGRPRDRRLAVRYPAVAGEVWVGWEEGRSFRMAAGRLLDIGLGGALIIVEAGPPEGRPIRLRLGGPPYLPRWFEAVVVAVVAGPPGRHAVRLAFPDACPHDLFAAVARGRAPAAPAAARPENPAIFGEVGGGPGLKITSAIGRADH